VGENQWAETTFTVRDGSGGRKLTTFDSQGKPTSGDDGYASHPKDPFPVAAVRPAAFAGVLEKIRSKQPANRLLGAVLTVAPFSHLLAWNISIVSPDAGSAILYQAGPDGSRLCHGRDNVPNDALVPAPGIPECDTTLLPAYSL
jgi:hypothetical protein